MKKRNLTVELLLSLKTKSKFTPVRFYYIQSFFEKYLVRLKKKVSINLILFRISSVLENIVTFYKLNPSTRRMVFNPKEITWLNLLSVTSGYIQDLFYSSAACYRNLNCSFTLGGQGHFVKLQSSHFFSKLHEKPHRNQIWLTGR